MDLLRDIDFVGAGLFSVWMSMQFLICILSDLFVFLVFCGLHTQHICMHHTPSAVIKNMYWVTHILLCVPVEQHAYQNIAS